MAGQGRHIHMIAVLAVLLSVLTTGTQGMPGPGVLTVTGCTETWLQMKCSSSDTIRVMDVRLAFPDAPSKPCPQNQPKNAVVPQEVVHLCPTKEECVYVETICEGRKECAFYVSPHLISGSEKPTTNSEVIVEYGCRMGKDRLAGVVILGVLAVLLFVILLVVVACLLWRTKGSTSYGVFDDSASVASSQAPSRSGATNGQGKAHYEAGTDRLDLTASSAATN